MDPKADTRARILDAAMRRIKHYGYAKTTMAEIAGDCEMSPGNIYRFFEAKIDIAEAMARSHYQQELQALSAIVRRADLSPEERLRALLIKRMTDNYTAAAQNDRILEVAEVLKKERPVFYNEVLANERVYIAAILEDGVRCGHFHPIGDSNFTAEIIQAATMKFAMPQLFSSLPLDRLARELDAVMDLLLHGLRRRDGASEKTADLTIM